MMSTNKWNLIIVTVAVWIIIMGLVFKIDRLETRIEKIETELANTPKWYGKLEAE